MLSFATVYHGLGVVFLANGFGRGPRGCLNGGGASALGRASPTKRAGFHLAFTWEKAAFLLGLARLAESPGLATFIFPRNPESDICVQVFTL